MTPPIATSFGKYQLLAELGQGGMAEVYLAVARGPVGFSKLQVVKQLRRHLVENPEFLAMFLDEARLAARLNHPNIVQTNEVGEQDGQYFIAMEYLDGQSHDHVLKRLRPEPLPLPFSLRVLSDALAALHYAHEATDFDGSPLHIVHRDVTPHNVFITYDGLIKLVDFGIAKAANCSAETRTGVLKGKIAFMSPEQARGDSVDRRADLFSVGIMLWEAIAKKRPWQGLNDMQILTRVANAQIPSIREVAPEAPEALLAICEKLLAFRPSDRFPTAAAAQAELERHLKTLPDAPTARDVGVYVAELFKDRRAEIRAILESRLHEVTQGEPPTSLPLLESASGSVPSVPTTTGSGRSRLPQLNPPSSALDAIGTPQTSPTTLEAAASVRPPRSPALIAVVAATLITAGLGAWLIRGTSTTPASETPSAAALPSGVAPPPPENTAPASVEVRIEATPPDAKLFFDEAPLRTNPFTGRFPRDGMVHRIRVEAPGYTPKLEVVTLNGPIEQLIALDRVAEAKPSRTAGPNAPAVSPAQGKTKSGIDKENPWAK